MTVVTHAQDMLSDEQSFFHNILSNYAPGTVKFNMNAISCAIYDSTIWTLYFYFNFLFKLEIQSIYSSKLNRKPEANTKCMGNRNSHSIKFLF